MKAPDNTLAFLRGASVVSVIIFHMYPNLFPYGFLGVDVFLVVSGYLVTKSFKEKFSEDYSLNNLLMYLNIRIKRVFPLLVFIVLVTIWLNQFLLNIGLFSIEYITAVFGLYNWYANTLIDYNKELMSASPLLHLWSVSVELQLYILFVIYLFIIHLLKIKISSVLSITILFIASFLLIFLTTLSVELSTYYSTVWRLAQFILGGLLFLKGRRLYNLLSIALLVQLYMLQQKSLAPHFFIPLLFINAAIIFYNINQTAYRGILILESLLSGVFVLFSALPYYLFL